MIRLKDFRGLLKFLDRQADFQKGVDVPFGDGTGYEETAPRPYQPFVHRKLPLEARLGECDARLEVWRKLPPVNGEGKA